MSSSRRVSPSSALGRASLLVTLCLGPVSVFAQSAPDYRERAMEVLPAYRDGIRAQRIADSLAQLAELPDTLREGALVVLSQLSIEAPVRRAMHTAWPIIEGRFGAAAGVLTQGPIRIWTPDSGRSYSAGETAIPGHSVSSQMLGEGQEAVTAGLIRFASLAVWSQADSTLRSWLPGALELTTDLARQRERTYYELVTSPATVTRSCYVGDVPACEVALGVVPVADSLLGWYDAAGRRALVVRFNEVFDRRPLHLTYYSCTTEGSDSACSEILHSARDTAFLRKSGEYGDLDLLRSIPPPLGPSARSTLLDEVMRIGGPDAWGRLLRSVGQPLTTRLAIAGGISMDSLMRGWRSGILEARPKPVSLPGHTAWVAVAWVTVLGVLGMRSSRWR